MNVARGRIAKRGRWTAIGLGVGFAWAALALFAAPDSASAATTDDSGDRGLLGTLTSTVDGVGEAANSLVTDVDAVASATLDVVEPAVVDVVTPVVTHLPEPVAAPVANLTSTAVDTAEAVTGHVTATITRVDTAVVSAVNRTVGAVAEAAGTSDRLGAIVGSGTIEPGLLSTEVVTVVDRLAALLTPLSAPPAGTALPPITLPDVPGVATPQAPSTLPQAAPLTPAATTPVATAAPDPIASPAFWASLAAVAGVAGVVAAAPGIPSAFSGSGSGGLGAPAGSASGGSWSSGSAGPAALVGALLSAAWTAALIALDRARRAGLRLPGAPVFATDTTPD
ncbi:MAG: hypothetical protein DI573_13580 [Microbacterium sp.]|uniref:hypothetical protein n=1 Tax=Microbacterium sp. TaxID=51671 RepID=UPI000DB4BF2B|nr:hypothetical protein [Microbacterium sp.]PZU36473.1 MAG: hypothetical protein DI573_13580 [Microbacterium sp.]